MRILQVIHGYPPYYMAGSEVYTYNLARELAKNNEVFVFCRFEDKTVPLYQYHDATDSGVNIRYINNYEPKSATFYDKYLNPCIDDMFRDYVRFVRPDVVISGIYHPNCRKDFINFMSIVFQLETFNKVEIKAPYAKISKSEIIKRGALMSIDYSKTWSCYHGETIHCGKCNACQIRKEDFSIINLSDPVRYENEC